MKYHTEMGFHSLDADMVDNLWANERRGGVNGRKTCAVLGGNV